MSEEPTSKEQRAIDARRARMFTVMSWLHAVIIFIATICHRTGSTIAW